MITIAAKVAVRTAEGQRKRTTMVAAGRVEEQPIQYRRNSNQTIRVNITPAERDGGYPSPSLSCWLR